MAHLTPVQIVKLAESVAGENLTPQAKLALGIQIAVLETIYEMSHQLAELVTITKDKSK